MKATPARQAVSYRFGPQELQARCHLTHALPKPNFQIGKPSRLPHASQSSEALSVPGNPRDSVEKVTTSLQLPSCTDQDRLTFSGNAQMANFVGHRGLHLRAVSPRHGGATATRGHVNKCAGPESKKTHVWTTKFEFQVTFPMCHATFLRVTEFPSFDFSFFHLKI